jgi:mobilome CxxCx(11)CxxC protein
VHTETYSQIRQVKLNALAAKYQHGECRNSLNRKLQRVDFLGIAVPSLYFAFRYYGKGTQYEGWVEGAWAVLATVLLLTTIAKMAYRWSDKAQKHSELLGENISLVGHANDLLREAEVSKDSLRLFSLLDEKLEKDDRRALGQLDEKDRQAAYRAALKELDPGNVGVLCSLCQSSPWKFTAGSCQMCGNTPTVPQRNA